MNGNTVLRRALAAVYAFSCVPLALLSLPDVPAIVVPPCVLGFVVEVDCACMLFVVEVFSCEYLPRVAVAYRLAYRRVLEEYLVELLVVEVV